MKKKIFIASIVVLSMSLTVIGFKCKQNQLPDFGHFLINAEALAESEQDNEWEHSYIYCRCQDDKKKGNVTTCQQGKANSTKTICLKANIGTSIDCHNHDANCYN